MALISVVVPVFKCEGCLDELYNRLKVSIEKITTDFEILLVEDCGGDGSWEIIAELCRKDKRVKGLQFSRNFGQHHGITAGLDYCEGEWVVVMDCDLQDQPEEIQNLYKKALEGYDIVFARRVKREDSYLKKLGSRFFYTALGYLTDTKLDAAIANFGIYRKNVINAALEIRESLRYFPLIVRWVGFKSTAIEVKHSERSYDKTSYTLKKLLRLALGVMISFSDKPLHLIVRLGSVISLISLCFALIIVTKYFYHGYQVEGWASVMVSLWFISGVFMVILGVVGVYVGKTFDETKRRPLYIINKKHNIDK